MKDEERVFRLTRRDGVIYWSGPYDHANQFGYERPLRDPDPGLEEVRHLSIADAFDAADKKVEALVEAATNARNVLDLNLELFEGEESSDERDSYEEVISVWGALRAALEPFGR